MNRRMARGIGPSLPRSSILKGGSGDLPAARRAYDELMTVKPDFTPQFIEWTPFIDRAWNRRLADGLATAMNDHKPASNRRR